MIADELERRLAAHERVRRAVEALAEMGPASQIIDCAAAQAARAADLDRVVLSRIEDGALVIARVHPPPEGAGGMLDERRDVALRLAYPLLECELLRRREARVVADIDHDQPSRYAFLSTFGWRAYVAAPIVVDGEAVGFLHGDRVASRQPGLARIDADALEHFAAGFALVYERAVLRRRLRDQRREIRRIASWAEARTGELGDEVIGLSADLAEAVERRARAPEILTEDGLATQLTTREIDVLRLMAEGKTNSDIARALFVSEGTVKFHVKNILRKMQAANRADASARYLRLTLHERPMDATSAPSVGRGLDRPVTG
ncbi:MAG TPA: LuxR C-terminal-related transcriptional regulator [Solirubrobacteraceae bacterium]|nr:LuxR C-terminal-related transcriptional regulator [Solirubrobacteraceae bacterium]